jgi:CRISPR-associated protein Cas1
LPGCPSLALDFTEEFSAPVSDRLALSLINRLQIQGKRFERSASRAVTLTNVGQRKNIQAWQKRKREELLHPYLNEQCPRGVLPYTQPLLLACHLRGDLNAYQASFWKGHMLVLITYDVAKSDECGK